MVKKILISATLASSLLVAGDLSKNDELVTHTELGYIGTTGNTETKTFNLESKLKKGFAKHIFALSFDGQYADDKGIESKNKYFLELNYDYEFTDRFAFNYLVGYKDDKFSAFDSQFYTGPGAKYKAIVSKSHNLGIEGNILYSVDKYSDIEYDASGNVISYPNANNTVVASKVEGVDDTYSSYRAKGTYVWQINKNLKFDQELAYRGSFEDSNKYFINSKTAFYSKISDIFSAGISYKYDYVNQAGDKDKVDTTFTANLIIDY